MGGLTWITTLWVWEAESTVGMTAPMEPLSFSPSGGSALPSAGSARQGAAHRAGSGEYKTVPVTDHGQLLPVLHIISGLVVELVI